MRPVPPIRVNANEKNILDHQQSVQKSLSNLSFGNQEGKGELDNFNGYWANGTSPGVADTQFEVKHNLGQVPVGYIVFYQDKAGSFYDSGTAWTKTSIFLKCSGVSVKYKLFVM